MKDFLSRLARRARLVAAREAFLDAFFWSSYAAASLLVADRIRVEFLPGKRVWSDAKGAAAAIGAALALSAVAAAVRALRTRPADADLARAADRSLGLADRVATAVEAAPGAFAPLVRRQAEDGVAGAAPRTVLPAPPAGARRWSIAAVIAAILIVLFPLPTEPSVSSKRPIRARRPKSGAAIEERGADGAAGGTTAGSATGAGGGGSEENGSSPDPKSGRGHPAPAPPLFGEKDRGHFQERPEGFQPFIGQGPWKPSGGLSVDPGAAAGGAPEAATDAERLASYRKQAEAFVGRDGFPEGDREIVKGYFERMAPPK